MTDTDREDIPSRPATAEQIAVPDEAAMKVLACNVALFRDVLQVRDEYGLDDWLFEIQRHGAAGDPKTSYSVMPEEQPDPEMTAKIVACALHDLEELATVGVRL